MPLKCDSIRFWLHFVPASDGILESKSDFVSGPICPSPSAMDSFPMRTNTAPKRHYLCDGIDATFGRKCERGFKEGTALARCIAQNARGVVTVFRDFGGSLHENVISPSLECPAVDVLKQRTTFCGHLAPSITIHTGNRL